MKSETARRLVDSINIYAMGLETVRDYALAGETVKAAQTYLKVLFERLSEPELLQARDEKKSLEQAKLLLDNKLSLLGTEPQDLGHPIDWMTYPDGDTQWQMHLTYMYFTEWLIRAWQLTGEACYAACWQRIVGEFLDNHPWTDTRLRHSPARPMYESEYLPVTGGEGFCGGDIVGSWLSLSCADRSMRLVREAGALYRAQLMDDELAARILLSSMGDHLSVMLANPRRGTPNQFLSISMALIDLGVSLWEFKMAGAAYLVGMQRLEEAVNICIYPDGSDQEQSFNYNFVILNLLKAFFAREELQKNRRLTVLREKMAARCDFLAAMMTPTRHMPDVAKTHANGSIVPVLSRVCEAWKGPLCSDILAACRGEKRDLPMTLHYPYGGYSVLRGGWTDEATYLFMKYSRFSPGHKHDDALEIVLTALGRDLLVDPGHYNYSGSPESMRWNNYFSSAMAHNVMTLDGLNQNRMALEKDDKLDERLTAQAVNEAEYEKMAARRVLHEAPCPGRRTQNGDILLTQGFYEDGYEDKPALYERQSYLIGGRACVIVDRMDAFEGEHDYELNWHLSKDFARENIVLEENGLTAMKDGTGFKLMLLTGADKTVCHYGEEEPPRGWYVLDYGEKTPAAYIIQKRHGGAQHCAVTLLAPVREGEDVKVSRNEDAWRVTLSGGMTFCVRLSEAGCTVTTDQGQLDVPFEM